jgi:hypothetical protein
MFKIHDIHVKIIQTYDKYIYNYYCQIMVHESYDDVQNQISLQDLTS